MSLSQILRKFRRHVALSTAASVVLGVTSASAHYCGPPIIRCKPGDVMTYYIVSDMAEVGDSFYSVFSQSEPGVAPLVFFTPVARIAGMYVFAAQQPGTNDAALFWSFPPNGAADFCLLRIIVQTNATTTAGNNPFSAFYGDPVNMYSGELVLREPPDLDLGGPMPLTFRRYYASRLQADAVVNSRLGDNWSHNFDWRAILVVTNQAIIVSPEGLRVRFEKAGANWILQSPAVLPFQLVTSGTDVVFGDPRDQRLYRFNTNGLLTAISDGRGNTHTLAYLDDFLLSHVSDGLGRTLNFTYAGARFLRTLSDGARAVGFFQQAVGSHFNLLRATNALGRTTVYNYDNSKEIGSLLTSRVDPLGNTAYAQVYDSSGRVAQQTHLATNVTRFAYNPNTFTTFTTNAQGHANAFVHSPDGQLLSLTDAAGQVLSLFTNAQGRRAAINDRAGGTLGISYDPASGKPAVITNADLTITRFTYTNRTVMGVTFHELSSVTMPDGASEQFLYDPAGNVVAHTDRAGKQTRMGYNARGQVTALTNAAGGTVTFTYNADGTEASRTDAEIGLLTSFYDGLRRATNLLASDGRSVRMAFDAGNRLVSLTDERTNTTFYAYDNNDRLTGITNAFGQVMRFGYDDANRLIAVTNALGRRTVYVYDSLDQLTAITNRNHNRWAMGYDARQRLTSLTDPGGKTWSAGYDNEATPVSFSNPIGHTIRQALDATGHISAITNAAGQSVSFGRDAMHRLASTLDPLGRVNQFRHDARGLLTNTTSSALGAASYEMNDLGLLAKLRDQLGREWRFNYTALGRLTNIADPLNRSHSITHDGRGRPQRLAFTDGSAQTNSYDPSGNLSRIDYSGGLSFTFAYDPLHRLTNASGLAFAYNPENRLTNTVSSGVNFGAAYDPGGRLTHVTYNAGAVTVTYVYDSRDRLVQVRDSLASAQVDFLYDDAGRLTNVLRANGVNGIYNHDAAGRVTRIREGAFLDLQYALNAAGEIAWVNATAPLSAAHAAGQTNDFTFDAGHQISSGGYSYDARGRLIASPGNTFAWNAASHLTRVNAVTNAYNGAGNLLTRATVSGTVRYHYNHALGSAPIVAEQNAGTGQFLRYYVWTPDGRLLYMIDAAAGNAVFYFHFDRVGSTLALTSAAGAVTDAYAYSPFGVLVARTGTNPQPFTYAGRYGVRSEPAGLYQMRARYYDPTSARFLSRDPVWPRPRDPHSLNPYVYAANNPLLHVDPTGGEPWSPQVQIEARFLTIAGLRNELGFDWSASPAAPAAAGGGAEQTAGGPVLIPSGEVRVSKLPLLGSVPIVGPLFRSNRNPQKDLLIMIRPALFDEDGTTAGGALVAGVTRNTIGSVAASASPPQPVSPVSPVNLMNLSTEMAMVNAYGAGLTVLRHTSPFGAHSPMAVFLGLGLGLNPNDLEPRGLAFVNGQMVRPKVNDLLQAIEWRRDFYDDLFHDYRPVEVYQILFRNALIMGGMGGLYLNAIATSPHLYSQTE